MKAITCNKKLASYQFFKSKKIALFLSTVKPCLLSHEKVRLGPKTKNFSKSKKFNVKISNNDTFDNRFGFRLKFYA
jgi:hypothetical protein